MVFNVADSSVVTWLGGEGEVDGKARRGFAFLFWNV